MTGGEFWVWAVVVVGTVWAFVRLFVAEWRDQDDQFVEVEQHARQMQLLAPFAEDDFR